MLRRIEPAKSGEYVLRRAILASLGSQLHGFELLQQGPTVTYQRFEFGFQNPVLPVFGSMNETNAALIRLTPKAIRRFSVESEFRELARKWKIERSSTSSSRIICTHPAYQRIIGLGLPVVPFILAELQRELDHWFWALKAITGDDPVQPESRGRMDEMAAEWLEWGRKHGLIR